MKEIKIESSVEGTAPYLMHKFVPSTGSRRKKEYIPEEEAEKVAYRNEDGKLYIPSSHFKAAMVKASTDFQMKGKKTYKEYIKAGVFIEDDKIILDQQDYVIHEEPVVINRSRVISWRPKINNWSCTFTMNVVDDMINVNTLKEILETAGKYKAVGDHRPEYGRFKVAKWDTVIPDKT